jgi:integrase
MSDVARGSTAIVEKTAPRGKAIVRGGKGTANRAYDLLSAMFSYSIQSGLRADNPAAGVKKYKLQRHERLLTDEEIQSIADALTKAEVAGVNEFALAAIRFLLLTGCRKSEALTLQWNWIDLNRGVLRLPDSKTGAKVVPIGQPAVDLLRLLPKQKGNPFVFPSSGSTDRHFTNIQKVWTDIRRDAGLASLRIHDLRHHYASVGASSGESLYVIGKILGHSQPHTTQRYAHIASDPVRRSADRISKSILAAIRPPQLDAVTDQRTNDEQDSVNLLAVKV